MHSICDGPRWLKAGGGQVQFHAVALLHALRAGDRLAVSKLVASLTRGAGMGASSVRSPLAQCLLVRYVAQVRRRSGTYIQRLASSRTLDSQTSAAGYITCIRSCQDDVGLDKLLHARDCTADCSSLWGSHSITEAAWLVSHAQVR